ncbi:IRF tryptophan pentad repeat domain-containing protein [Trichonephila clavata]|uniref:IRF tryptophan pentad repeat domain-containing protein n=1 Tax=Trichonephila clavata TaxID=2740835 RepID=A0A8X6I6E9_TRICU|nr:IRF tryptophan pentad repeat domain-containing protein [Trichonephila clavata]
MKNEGLRHGSAEHRSELFVQDFCSFATMGRKGSILVPFLKDGLIHRKYKNLRFEDQSKSIFVLDLPQKTCRLDREDEKIFKEWYKIKGKDYCFSQGYSKAKQNFEASLKKSEYLERVPSKGFKICYRILQIDEVKALKRRKKMKKDSLGTCPDSESGYESVESPPSIIEKHVPVDSMLKAIEHDHSFGLSTSTVIPILKEKSKDAEHVTNLEPFLSDINQISSEDKMFFTEKHVTTLFKDFNSHNEERECFPVEDFGEVSLEDLEKIPENEFIVPNNTYKNFCEEIDLAESGQFLKAEKKKEIVYLCNHYEFINKTLTLLCEQKELLLEDKMDDNDEKKIFFNEDVFRILQSCKGIKEQYFVKKNMVIRLELKNVSAEVVSPSICAGVVTPDISENPAIQYKNWNGFLL